MMLRKYYHYYYYYYYNNNNYLYVEYIRREEEARSIIIIIIIHLYYTAITLRACQIVQSRKENKDVGQWLSEAVLAKLTEIKTKIVHTENMMVTFLSSSTNSNDWLIQNGHRRRLPIRMGRRRQVASLVLFYGVLQRNIGGAAHCQS